MSEAATRERRGFFSSFQYVTLVGGHVLAQFTLLIILAVFNDEQVHEFGWRIGFAVGGVAAVVVFWLRRTMDESLSEEQLAAIRAGQDKSSGSMRELFTRYRRPLLLWFGFGGLVYTYILITYLPETRSPITSFLLVAVGYVILTGYTSINALVKSELFPAHVRALGVGLGYALANSMFGGTAPVIYQALKARGEVPLFIAHLPRPRTGIGVPVTGVLDGVVLLWSSGVALVIVVQFAL